MSKAPKGRGLPRVSPLAHDLHTDESLRPRTGFSNQVFEKLQSEPIVRLS